MLFLARWPISPPTRLQPFSLGPPRTNGVFYAKLLDREGNTIPQDPKWASDHRQKEFNYSGQPFSRSIQQINPAGKTQFDFKLEDAYLDKAALGKELIISWESIYYLPTIQTNEYIDSKGNTVPAKEEPYKFLSFWEISTSLPLVAVAEKPALNPPAGQIPVNPTSQNAAPNKLEPTAKNSPNLSHRGWWLLLLIPASLIAYRLTRQS